MGDKVLAYNEETGEQAYKQVVQLFRNTSKDWIGLTVNDTEIVSTPGHKYYLPETKQWVSAKDLCVGTVVLLNNGTRAKIEAKREIHYEEPQTTYNFEVAEFHTYYVGTGVLVHNQNCGLKNKVIFIDDVEVYKNVRMDLELGGSGMANLHIHAVGDKFIFNGVTYVNSAGQVIPSVIANSKVVAEGFLKAVKYASKVGWTFI